MLKFKKMFLANEVVLYDADGENPCRTDVLVL